MSDSTLHFDTAYLYAQGSHSFGITATTQENTAAKIAAAKQHIEEQVAQHAFGFIEQLKNQGFIDQVRAVFSQLSWAKTFVVIGIGGSDLGARAVQQAVQSDHPPMEVVFHGDSTDPVALTRLLARSDLNTTVFNIISKSGQTVETTAQYVYLKHIVRAAVGDAWQKHFVFTTDAHEGILRKEAEQFGVLSVPIPPDVGGRFSVLTPVGTLPALAMGVDITQLLSGAQRFAADSALREQAYLFAATQYQLFTQHIALTVMMPYSIQLEEFARWFRQLWAESLGKNNTGILPIQARGPADQHSQGQFYNQGSPIMSLFFVTLKHRDNDVTIQDVDLADATYLNGHTFHELISVEQRAFALALRKQGRPSCCLEVERLTPESLGMLFMFFELAVVMLAALLDVNAFDQPGVEEGKQMMYALLGRPGFEEKKKEIDALQ